MENKILIVDDELSKRQVLYERIFAESIKKDWYTLEFAPSGEKALEIIKNDRNHHISLIVLDLRLDGAMINGVELANTLARSHIDKKFIVWTAYPEWINEFSDLAHRQIITVVQRVDYSNTYLKDICDAFMIGQQLELPGKQGINAKSNNTGYHTIQKLAKGLTEDQRYNLLLTLLPYFSPSKLMELQQEIPEKIGEFLEDSFKRDNLRQWIEKQQKIGTLPETIPPARYLVDPYLEIVERKNKPNTNPKNAYLEYFLRWSEEGRHKSKYLKKALVETLPLVLKEPWNYPQLPDSFKVVQKKQ